MLSGGTVTLLNRLVLETSPSVNVVAPSSGLILELSIKDGVDTMVFVA